jgi:chlorite dismutase
MKANVKARSLLFKTEDIKKQLHLKDGGEEYVFVFPFKEKAWFVHAHLAEKTA